MQQSIKLPTARVINLAKNSRNAHKALFWVMVFTIITRIAIYASGIPWDERVINNTILDGDGKVYHDIAIGFLEGVPLSEINPEADRTLGYPYFVTALYAISNKSVWFVLAIQTLLNILMVPMIYWITSRIFNSQTAGIFGSASFSLSAIPVAWASRYLFTETLFSFLVLIFLMGFIYSWRRDSIKWFLLLGLILGIATVVRSALQFFIAIPMVIIFFQDHKVHRKIFLAAVMALGFMVVIAPFQFRNLQEYGHYSLSTTAGNMFTESAIRAKALADGTNIYDAKQNLESQIPTVTDRENPFELSAMRKEEGFKSLNENLNQWLLLYLQGLVSFVISNEKSSYLYVIFKQERPVLSNPETDESFSQRIIRNIRDIEQEHFVLPLVLAKQLIEYIAVTIGLLILVVRKNRTMALLFVFTILYFVLTTGMVGRAPRYRIPVLPIYAILSGGGFCLIWSWLPASKLLGKLNKLV